MGDVAIDLTGQRFGRLTVVQRDGTQGSKAVWRCQCDCGSIIRVIGNSLRSGKSQSCRCLRRPVEGRRHASRDARREKSPTLMSWQAMHDRCTQQKHPRYHRYGGRGIGVCARWHDFASFLADMGPRPEGRTLDRINNDGQYEPGNCRWATPKEQAANRRHPCRQEV